MPSFLREFSFSRHLLGTIGRTLLDLVLAIPSLSTTDFGKVNVLNRTGSHPLLAEAF